VNGPYLWQGIQFYKNTGFFTFCDYIEGVSSNSTQIPGASGVGLKTALTGYANWMKTELIPGYCESYGTSRTSFRPVVFQLWTLKNRAYHLVRALRSDLAH